MKSKPVVSNEVLVVDSEEMLPEVPLEKVIDTALVKANVTDSVIASLKEQYGGMQLKSIDDKETYLEICSARKVVRKVGIIAEDCCKRGRERAVKEQKLWISKQAEILGKIGEVQDPLDSEIEKFENEVERKELAEAKKKEEMYINRQSTLLKLGANYNNGSFELNHISYEVELIKQADEEQWNDTILPKYRKVFEEVEAARVQEEEKRKEELTQQKAEREKFEAEQKKFREEQEIFAKQQRDLQEQKEAHEKEQRLAQQRKEEEQKKQELDLLNSRLKQLPKITWNGVTGSYAYYDKIITRQSELLAMDEETFNSFRDNHIVTVEADTKEANEKRNVQLEKEKQAAIELAAQQERERILNEQRQADIKKQQEEQRRQEQLAQSNDRTKWEYFLTQLDALSFPTDLRSSIFKSKLSITKEKIEEIKNL